MSLHVEPVFDVPELMAEIARAVFPEGNVYMQIRALLQIIQLA